MENSTLQKEDVGGIIQQGVSSYLNQNKNISVKDLLTKKSRETAGNQLKTTLRKTALDTGQNVINHLRKEEVSRRKKPSNVRKAKRLEYALLTLKQKKDDAKKAGALKEGDARANKLADAVRSGITTGTISSTSKVKKLDKIITKIRGIKEQVSKMKPSDYKTPGRTHDIKAKEVKDNELATREPDKGSALATQGKRDNEVKDERKPKPYRNKKGKGIKGPSKDAINKTVSKVGSAAKKGLSAFTSGYDNQEVKESQKIITDKETGHKTAVAIPVMRSKTSSEVQKDIENATKQVNKYIPSTNTSTKIRTKGTSTTGITGNAFNSNAINSKSFESFTEAAATAVLTSPIWAPKVAGAVMTAVGAGGMIYNMTKKGTKREDEFSTAPRNVSARQKRNRRKGDEGEARANDQRGSYDKSIQPGDNPEARANIRDILKKLNQKNNKLYNDYHNPKPPG